jgi:hypothetical protein
MTPEQRRYLFVECVIGAAIINAIINGGLGWLATRGMTTFAVWKIPGVAADLLATAYGVSFGTCIGAAVQVRVDTARGKITVPDTVPQGLATILATLPKRLLPRAIAMGIVSAIVLSPFILVGLFVAGNAALPIWPYITVKALMATVEGAAVTPVIVLAALVDYGRRKTAITSV